MSSPICRIVTMYRIAWKNLKTGYIGHGEFILTLQEAQENLIELKNRIGFDHWIESEDMDSIHSWTYF